MRYSLARTLLSICLVVSFSAVASLSAVAFAQDYQLVEPTGVITADVYMRPGQMVVNDANGQQYLFQRDRSFDSIDRSYAGYWLPSVNRVVRFPRSGSGLMQVADLDDAFPRYVFSRRSVRAKGRPGRGPRPHHHHRHGVVYIPPYFLSPYGYPGYVYGYQSYGTSFSVGQVTVGPFGIGSFTPPFWGPPAWLGPPAYGPPAFGRRIYRPPLQSIVLDSRVVPRRPLPPVTLQLLNSASREMIVTVSDRLQPDRSKRLRIAPGSSQPIQVERDAGADRVRQVRTFAPDGSTITREISTPIDPVPRYELVVHEWRLQSVAIDRTGKSPNVIEDTQFQGRGIGRFQLPPGDQVTGGTLDVVRTALQAGNQGTVNPILDNEGSSDPLRPVSPLEKILLEQRKAQRSQGAR